MRLKTITITALALTLSLCAAAQTSSNVSGVGLSGNPGDAVIENHAGKPIIAILTLSTPGGEPARVRAGFFVHAGQAIQDGTAANIGRDRRAKGSTPIVSAQLIAVIFADGEFRGESRYQFQSDAEKYFASIREVFAMAKAGEWDNLRARTNLSDPEDMLARGAARRLLDIHDRGGDAVKSLAHYGLLPTSMWKAVPTAKAPAFIGGIIEALSNWMHPATAHAQSTFSNVTDYDNASSWCQTWYSSMYPCPDPGGVTPWVGKKGSCGGNPPNTPGITINVGIDDFNYPQVSNRATVWSDNTFLYVAGNCKDVFFNPQNVEEWYWRIYCANSLYEVYDSSGTYGVCGTQVVQYPFH